jgi:hypothetical protein
MKIALIAPSGAVASALNQLELDSELDEVVVVSSVAPDSHIRSAIISPSLQGLSRRAERVLGGSVLGRNALRLSPLDAGRRFAGAFRRGTAVRQQIEDVDLIVVLERDGILAGWQAVRRWAPAHARAVYGLPPAQAILAAARA